MKKVLSLMFSLMMLLSFSTVSFATSYRPDHMKGATIQMGDYSLTLDKVEEGVVTLDVEGRKTKDFSVEGAISDKNGTLIALVNFTGVVYKGFGDWVFRSIDSSYEIKDNRCTEIVFEHGETGSSKLVVGLHILFASGAVERPLIDFVVDSEGNVEAEWR